MVPSDVTGEHDRRGPESAADGVGNHEAAVRDAAEPGEAWHEGAQRGGPAPEEHRPGAQASDQGAPGLQVLGLDQPGREAGEQPLPPSPPDEVTDLISEDGPGDGADEDGGEGDVTAPGDDPTEQHGDLAGEDHADEEARLEGGQQEDRRKDPTGGQTQDPLDEPVHPQHGTAAALVGSVCQDRRVPSSAVALIRSAAGWGAFDVDPATLEDLDAAAELLRERGSGGAAVLLIEEDDEWVGIVRLLVDDDVSVFLSDRRSATTSVLAERIFADALPAPAIREDKDDDDESARPEIEPAGDVELVADLGMAGDQLLEVCAAEGSLPSDVISAVADAAGATEALESVRPA